MKNVLEIDGYNSIVSFDPESNRFRGEFIGLKGGADFYAADVKSLKREGGISLKVFLEMCRESGLAPRKSFSGKLIVRLPAEVHQRASIAAASNGKSLNAWLADLVARAA